MRVQTHGDLNRESEHSWTNDMFEERRDVFIVPQLESNGLHSALTPHQVLMLFLRLKPSVVWTHLTLCLRLNVVEGKEVDALEFRIDVLCSLAADYVIRHASHGHCYSPTAMIK